MRARRDDPTLLKKPPVVNVLSLVPSLGLDAEAIAETLLAPIRSGAAIAHDDGLFPELAVQPRLAEAAEGVKTEATKADVKAIIGLFEEADVYGSLIRVPASLAKKLSALRDLVRANLGVADLDRQATARELSQLVRQAEFLAAQYTVCVANPPYLGGKARCKELKDFAEENYPDTKSDLFAMFIERGFDFAESNGFNAMVTMQSWMFLSGYDTFRENVVENKAICSMVHMGNGVMGIAFGTAATSIRNSRIPGLVGTYCYAEVKDLGDDNRPVSFPVRGPRCTQIAQSEFKKIPGWPIAYWATESVRDAYVKGHLLNRIADPCKGIDTGENGVLLRLWHEVNFARLSLSSHERTRHWVPYNKGGEFRRWYGNREWIVNFSENGKELRIRQHWDKKKANLRNEPHWFKPCFSWTSVSSGGFSARYSPEGALFDNGGSSVFAEADLEIVGALLNSSFAKTCFEFLSPTLNFQPGDVGLMPAPTAPIPGRDEVVEIVRSLVQAFKADWDEHETSWDFSSFPNASSSSSTSACWEHQLSQDADALGSAMAKERRLSEIVLSWFGMDSGGLADTTAASISLSSNPAFTYKKRRSKVNDAESDEPDAGEAEAPIVDADELLTKRRTYWTRELISYSVGTVMGRFSLDEPGLIYANENGTGFNPSRYQTFPADRDGILPVTEDDFFGDEDTANRFGRWVKAVWPNSPLDENLDFIADALGRKANETALETIRRYLATDFYKDHLQTYKKRPIYWLFSSGKHRAFQALVYLHRYNESTLSTMRSDYVTPLLGKYVAMVGQKSETGVSPTGNYRGYLHDQQDRATSAAEKSAIGREILKRQNQRDELFSFDAWIHHYALKRISLDLDDGVKVNYGKFSDPTIGEILANVKDITGGKDE
jgi:hypothetical protein